MAYFQQSEISSASAMQPILKMNKIFHNNVPVSQVICYLTTLYKLLMLHGNDKMRGPKVEEKHPFEVTQENH